MTFKEFLCDNDVVDSLIAKILFYVGDFPFNIPAEIKCYLLSLLLGFVQLIWVLIGMKLSPLLRLVQLI